MHNYVINTEHSMPSNGAKALWLEYLESQKIIEFKDDFVNKGSNVNASPNRNEG